MRPQELPAFAAASGHVEEARSALLSAVPGQRGAAVPLAEALAGFESHLSEASEAMPGWRVEADLGEWEACRVALQTSGARAERLRMEAVPGGYEQLWGMLQDILEPLDAFTVADERLRRA